MIQFKLHSSAIDDDAAVRNFRHFLKTAILFCHHYYQIHSGPEWWRLSKVPPTD